MQRVLHDDLPAVHKLARVDERLRRVAREVLPHLRGAERRRGVLEGHVAAADLRNGLLNQQWVDLGGVARHDAQRRVGVLGAGDEVIDEHKGPAAIDKQPDDVGAKQVAVLGGRDNLLGLGDRLQCVKDVDKPRRGKGAQVAVDAFARNDADARLVQQFARAAPDDIGEALAVGAGERDGRGREVWVDEH